MSTLISGPNRKWWTVIAMSGVMIALTPDFFGLTVALPEIGKDLGASYIVGRRKVVLVGIVLFVVGSALCAAADSDVFLIGARIIQGLGGGTIFVTSVSIVNNAFVPSERAKALGIWSGVGLMGSALGPFVAGILTEYGSWRWFFLLNIPIGILTFLITLAAVDESRDESYAGGIDWWGTLLLILGFAPLIFGIQQGSQSGWSSPEVLAGIVVGVVALIVFVLVGLHMTKRTPLVQFSLFRDVRFAGANTIAFLGNWQFGTILFFLTLYLQNVLSLDPVEAGLVFLTFSIPLVVMSPIGDRLVAKYGAQVLMSLGMGLIAVGLACFAALGVDSGIGLVISGAVFRGLENDEMFTRFAAVGERLTASEQDTVRGLLSGSEGARTQLGKLAPAAEDAVDGIVDAAFVRGQRGVMILGVILCAIGVWTALWGRARVATRREKRYHRVAHGFSHAHYQPEPAN